MKLFNWLTLLSLTISTPLLADTTERIVSITTAPATGTFYLAVNRASNGEVESLIYQGPGGHAFSVAQLRNPKGEALMSQGGHDIIILSLESDFTPEKGGHADVKFLTNGMTGSYKIFRLLMDVQDKIVLRSDPNPRQAGSDRNPYTSTFTKLRFVENILFGNPIGINKIVPSE